MHNNIYLHFEKFTHITLDLTKLHRVKINWC